MLERGEKNNKQWRLCEKQSGMKPWVQSPGLGEKEGEEGRGEEGVELKVRDWEIGGPNEEEV